MRGMRGPHVGPPFPIHQPGKFIFKQLRTLWTKWTGTLSSRIRLLLMSCRGAWFSYMSRNELLVMMSSLKKCWPVTPSCVSTHHTSTLGLPCSCYKCSPGDSLHQMTQLCWLTCSEMWNLTSSVKTVWLKKLSCSKICSRLLQIVI
jgi:hypothetical protein